MTELSPAAQAVLDAFRAVPDLRDGPSIAAALRVVADQCKLEWDYHPDYSETLKPALAHINAIATELENAQ